MWQIKNNCYSRTLMGKDEYNVCVEEQVWNTGHHDLLEDKTCICGYYIIDGSLSLYDQHFHKDMLIWIDGGQVFNVLFENSAHVLYIETMKPLLETFSYQLFDDHELTWSRPLADGMTASKHMIKAEDYGVKIQNCIYTKDFEHAWHTHTAAHGFYVLEGMLQYDFEDGRKGIYGPGEFVASKPGENILHVQAPESSYCKYIFIGDGPFDFIVDGVNLYGR
ncbi:MAG: hypothetical protein J6P61_07830 [Erysipelotrichaceae bacterium]|nr:hypothetical protein [Erysipelotrichaceae bacterium]